MGKNVRKFQGGIYLTHTVVYGTNSPRYESLMVLVVHRWYG